MPRVTEHALDVGRDRGIAAQQLVAAFRRRRELGAALGTAALDFRGHAATRPDRAIPDPAENLILFSNLAIHGAYSNLPR